MCAFGLSLKGKLDVFVLVVIDVILYSCTRLRYNLLILDMEIVELLILHKMVYVLEMSIFFTKMLNWSELL